MKNYFHFIWLIIFAFPQISILAQSEGLKKDSLFFNKQQQIYQKWLNQIGLGEILSTQQVDVYEKQVSLFLKFPFSNTDSVASAWQQLKLDFDAQHPERIEEALFFNMIRIMEIDLSEGNVQIWDKYNAIGNKCFVKGIYFEEGQIKVDSWICKADLEPINFSPTDFSQFQKSASANIDWADFGKSVEQIKTNYSADAVFKIIFDYAKVKFEKNYDNSDCTGRKPKVKEIGIRNNRVLRFSVEDLCREVLVEEANHWLCDWINVFRSKPCNWIKREKLIFEFYYEATDEGFELTGSVNGLFGSGYYDEIKRGGYVNMEEDARFKPYLLDFATIFSGEVRQAILRKK